MIQSEQELKRSFSPLTSNKDGKSPLTFGGYKHTVNKQTGEPRLKIVFSCLDVTHKNPQNIGINSRYNYSESNVLGKLLKTMGYVHKIKTVVVDDSEFGHRIDENLNDIYDFLDSQRGLVFKGSLSQKPDSAFYDLDVLTLEKILDKEGNQKRAYDAVDGLSGDQLVVDIEGGGDITTN